MPVLFLHIGAGKTGTSALQVAFARNAWLLRQRGTFYPGRNEPAATGRITSGNGTMLVSHLVPDLKLPAAGKRDIVTVLRETLKRASGKNVLYSSELLQRFDLARMTQVVEAARSEDFTVRIAYYVRSIAGQAYSAYVQNIKRHKCTRRFREFLTTYKNDFLSTIERSVAAVGRNNVRVRNYDTVRKDLFEDFRRNVLEIQPAADVGFINPGMINRTLTPHETEFVRRMNERFESGRQSTLLSDALIYSAPESERRVIITEEEKAALETRYGKDIEPINSYIDGAGIRLIGEGIEIGERPAIEFSNFEHRLMDALTLLLPQSSITSVPAERRPLPVPNVLRVLTSGDHHIPDVPRFAQAGRPAGPLELPRP